MGVRTKLFTVSLSLILLVIAVSGVFLERELRTWFEDRIELSLRQRAMTIREAISNSESDPEALGILAHRLGKSSACRVTLIAPDGTVLADSELTSAQVARTENHGTRPEVITALGGEVGTARRLSTTVAQRMQYVAVPIVDGHMHNLIVRVAVPIETVSGAIGRLRRFMLFAGLLGLVVAMGLSLAASYLMSRALESLVQSARIASSEETADLEVGGPDDSIVTSSPPAASGSFNQMADELRQTLAALATERSRFETVLNSMSEAVLVLDGNQVITMVNPASLALLDLSTYDVGRPLLDVVRITALDELARQGLEGPASVEFPLSGEPGRRVLARATPLRTTGGTVIAMHDITEMRRLETIRKDFVANVSHELRTPVSIIRANAETLLDGALDDPDRARSFIEALHRNSERLSRIIADLLDLSRVEAGRYEFEITAVELQEAVARAAEAVETRAQSRRVAMEVSVPADLSARADAKALDQVLLNLLDNSIKYTPEDGHVAVRVEERGGEIRIEVQDDGPGIKPEHRARIFERFYRIDPGRSRDMGGTGLGLAIVKHFVESMGGRVGVNPAFPRGSIFWVTLPLATQSHEEPTIIAV